ncbi:Phosphate metabolism transcription protein [Elasticomyces elasticus]|nr:Phosphate metabolism transcription protein [Elasticomyces elasticus]
MRFGKTLRKAIYAPWKDSYINYDKLKELLREDGPDEERWTEDDEGRFVDELVNEQLEKVHAFHSETYQKLRDRTSKCEAKLDPVVASTAGSDGARRASVSIGHGKRPLPSDEENEKILREVMEELDGITREINELEKYSRINYTGFLKAAKKHDRKRGHAYRVRPLLQVRLAALPFNKEDYSPLLYRLSVMYSFARQNLEGKDVRGMSFSESQTSGDIYTSYKFWVHPENLLEVKTVILRRLPVLVYNPQTSKVAEGAQRDPTITSIYFDNPKFTLYTDKVEHAGDPSSLRLRWFGQLSQKPEIVLEKKTVKQDDTSEEERFPIKDKYIQPFIKGEYKMEKQIAKLQERSGGDSVEHKRLKTSVKDIQEFILRNNLQPVLRANYSRTAFQIPGDDRVRISLDTDIAFIREDALDNEKPCRDPEEWHRKDIDEAEMEYPFSAIRKDEVNRFPFALMEVKLRNQKKSEWVEELMASHLVKEAPRFSKFVHGVAQLFEDHVNTFPFWLSEMETDIRREPLQAFEEEQARKQQQKEDEFAVGSLVKTRSSPVTKPSVLSPVGSPNVTSSIKPSSPGKATPEIARRASLAHAARANMPGINDIAEEEEGDSRDDGAQGQPQQSREGSSTNGLRSLFPSFSTSKYARSRRERNVALPPGVQKPSYWIKDQGEIKVEAKVWLANQRTFIKWQHVSVLLASLSLGLYNAAGGDNNVARALAVAYTLVAAFAAIWGWSIYIWRSRLIERRSGRDFDNAIGPCVVCIGLVIALLVNFGFKASDPLRDRMGTLS